jgi:hypothetical protein
MLQRSYWPVKARTGSIGTLTPKLSYFYAKCPGFPGLRRAAGLRCRRPVNCQRPRQLAHPSLGDYAAGMGKKFGFSFSLNRALGISAEKARISRAIGVPLTRSGQERKLGRIVGRGLGLAFLFVFVIVFAAVSAVIAAIVGAFSASVP